MAYSRHGWRLSAAELTAGQIHAERFGHRPAHYRAVYAQAGAPWPCRAFVRRHHPVADHRSPARSRPPWPRTSDSCRPSHGQT